MLLKKIFIFVLATLLAIEWISSFFLGGVIGVVSWWGIMWGSILGLSILLCLVMLFLVKLIRRKKFTKYFFIILALFTIMALPFIWFLNIGHIAYPAKIESTKPAVSINSPLKETVVVGWGGDDIKTNQPHAIVPSERWAYDLLIEPHSVMSENLNEYGIYNKEIISPVKGTIIGVYDEEQDITPGTEDNETLVGNYIYIEIEETGTYLVLSHIKQNSIIVKNGQTINEGTPLARVGNSGSSSEPHLHIHHQKQNPAKTSTYLSEGLPLYFKNIEGNSMPNGGENGDIISPKLK